jgi:hypothetical protein
MGQQMRKPNEKIGLQTGFMCHYTFTVNTDDETHKVTVMVWRCQGRYLSRDHYTESSAIMPSTDVNTNIGVIFPRG